MAKRYCANPDCDTRPRPGHECCDACEADARRDEREKLDDDGREYGHPGDYMRGWE